MVKRFHLSLQLVLCVLSSGIATQMMAQNPENHAPKLFLSSNTTGNIGVLDLAAANLSIQNIVAGGLDADGIYYDQKTDVLYQLNRTNNVVNAYADVLTNLALGLPVAITATSTSDFSNGREIAVSGNKLVVTQDAAPGNGDLNKFIVYDISANSITLDKIYTLDINLWGILFAGSSLIAVEDNSNRVAIYENFFQQPAGTLMATTKVSVEALVRTHGIAYDAQSDLMILTDVGDAASATDGALMFVSDWTQASADGTVSVSEQIILAGPNTLLGNPVDVAYSKTEAMVYVAERANLGGQLLAFAIPTSSGNPLPDAAILFPGASAIVYSRIAETSPNPTITLVDPKFSADFLVTARLNGAQEVPAVSTNAVGVATITMNADMTQATINATVSSLSSAFAGAHIHMGASGANGPVMVDLTNSYRFGRITQTFAVDATLRTAILSGNTYLNVHTATNLGGEIRGQLAVEAPLSFVGVLSGLNQVPAVAVNATGLVSAHYTSNTQILEINAQWTGLSSPITGAHLHVGAAGSNGPVVQDLITEVVGNTIRTKVAVTSYGADLLNGNIYLNVHTGNNPDGEIRVNLTPNAGLVFDTWLTGNQEVPSVVTDGIGLAVCTVSPDLATVSTWVQVDDLSGIITASHLHNAALGASGGVILDLSAGISHGTITQLDLPISSSTLITMLSGNAYVNVHTTAFAGGEIRGQLYRLARLGYAYDMCPQQEVTPPTGAALVGGSGMFAFNRDMDEAHAMFVANNLSSAFMGAHIHNGAMGTDGPVVFNATPIFANGGAFFYFTDQGAMPFNAAFAEMVRSGNAYVNIHTVNNPGGELRGQIVDNLTCPILTATLDLNAKGFEVTVFPNPTVESINVGISEAIFDETQEVTLRLMDAMGRQIWQKTTTQSQNRYEVATLPTGQYQVLVQVGNSMTAIPFVKVR